MNRLARWAGDGHRKPARGPAPTTGPVSFPSAPLTFPYVSPNSFHHIVFSSDARPSFLCLVNTYERFREAFPDPPPPHPAP